MSPTAEPEPTNSSARSGTPPPGSSGTEPVSVEVAALLQSCTQRRLWAEQDEGPYHRDAQPVRRDVVEDRDGVPLRLGIRLTGDGDRPPSGASVEIWQCDALGRYSGFPPPDPAPATTAATGSRAEYLEDQTFLRGRQTVDDAGMVEFRTIHPGWYPGRTVHIHLKVETGGATLTSQLYFPDELSDQVLARPPYAERRGRDTTNATDVIFPTGGDPAVLDISATDEGYTAAIRLVIPAPPAAADR
jgi:protocatechuate 3,4-dioxygenase beta subunit